MIQISQINKLPSTIGVYLFYQKDKPIYIGKSINVKARVRSHFQSAQLVAKERQIINFASRIKYFPTISEFDALLLEAKLIKKYEPKYNVILKDDKHYLYIKISISEEFPKVTAVRRENDGQSLYFGPLGSTKVTQSVISVLRSIIPFCTSVGLSRSACFYSKIGLCNPCPSNIIKLRGQEFIMQKRLYRGQIRHVIAILSGKRQTLYRKLSKEMNLMSSLLRYEEAMSLRNKLTLFDSSLSRRSFGNDFDNLNLLPPSQIGPEVAQFMQLFFNEEINPNKYRLECVDFSTLSGKQSAGSVVVFDSGQFDAGQYRRYRISGKSVKSDFDMLKELLKRRFGKEQFKKPTLLVIDGGNPHLRIAKRVLEELQIQIPIIGIAKKPDRIIFEGDNIRPRVDRSDLIFKLIVSMRDEAHRFARKYHLHLRRQSYMI